MRTRFSQDQRGQGMTETVIIVALVAIAAIGVVGVFGDNIRAMMGTSVDALAGNATPHAGQGHAGVTSDHRNVKDFAEHTDTEVVAGGIGDGPGGCPGCSLGSPH